MRQLQCPRPDCESYALLRIRRSFFTKLRFPASRQYRCGECASTLIVDPHGTPLKTRISTSK